MVSRAIRGRSTGRIRNAGPETRQGGDHLTVGPTDRARPPRSAPPRAPPASARSRAMRISRELRDQRAESTIVDGVGRSSGRAEQPVAVRRRRMLASSTLPFDVQCSGVRRPTQLTADDRARARDLIDVDDRVAREHAEVHGLARPLGEVLEDRARGADQVEARHRRAGQPDQAEPQPVLLGDGVALEQAALGERRDEPRGRGLVDVEPRAELGDAQLAGLGDQLQRPDRAVDRLEVAASSARLASRRNDLSARVQRSSATVCVTPSTAVKAEPRERGGRTGAVLAGRRAQDRPTTWSSSAPAVTAWPPPTTSPQNHGITDVVRGGEGLAGRRQHGPQHHDHPLELPLGRVAPRSTSTR